MESLKTLTITYQSFQPHTLSPQFKALYHAVKEARLKSYSPYSGFKVGAAALLHNGTLVGGSNQENCAYPSGSCAERTLLDTVGHAHNPSEVKALAVIGGREESSTAMVFPCGNCRQLMVQFQSRADHDVPVLVCSLGGEVLLFKSSRDLLPFSFTGKNLE